MSAFTLIETIVYIALFSIVMQGALAGVIAIQKSESRNEEHTRLFFESEYLAAKLTYELAHAQNITEPQTNDHSADLRYTDYDGLNVHIFATGNDLVIARGSGLTQSLHDFGTEIRNVTFYRSESIDNITNPAYLSFTFEIKNADGDDSHSETRSRRIYLSP